MVSCFIYSQKNIKNGRLSVKDFTIDRQSIYIIQKRSLKASRDPIILNMTSLQFYRTVFMKHVITSTFTERKIYDKDYNFKQI